MKKIFTLSLLCLLSVLTAVAQSPVEAWTRVVSAADGTFFNKQGNAASAYKYKWQSTDIDPQLTLSTTNNDMWVDGDGTFHLYVREFTLAVPDGYAITGYSFTFAGYEGAATGDARQEVTVTPSAGGTAVTCDAEAASATLTVTGIESVSASFAVSSPAEKANAVPTGFTVSIKKVKSAIDMLQTTTLVNGQFAPSTTWYNLSIHNNRYILAYPGDATPFTLLRTKATDDDNDQWCLVGDNATGYTLYNKAAGPQKALVSPKTMSGVTGGQAYPVVLPLEGLDESTYESKWKLEVSTDIAGETGFYVEQFSTGYGINNRDNKLAFWTTGFDHGSTVLFQPALYTFEVDEMNGTFANGQYESSYMAKWASTRTNPGLLFFNCDDSNNMMPQADKKSVMVYDNGGHDVYALQAEDGYVIDGYSFDFTSAEAMTVTPSEGGDPVSILANGTGHLQASGINARRTDFKVTGDGILSHFYVTLKAGVPADNAHTRIVFDNASSDVPYRIPALTETKDGKLIAVCDYRISKTDIGYNNKNGLYQINEVMKTSTDHGRTWSEEITIAQGDEYAAEEWRTAFGDPSIIADRTSDEVLMHSVSGKVGYFASTRTNPQHAVFFRSMDGGQHWDQGTDLTEQIYGLYDGTIPGGSSPAGIFLTSGKIMQSRYIKVGNYYRLYIAHPMRVPGINKFAAYVIYSDDFGRNWQVLGGPGVIPSDAADESKVEELPDGSVLLSCRNQSVGGRKLNIYTYSNPKTAEGQWSTDAIPAPMSGSNVNACNGELLIIPAKRNSDGQQLFVALQSVPQSTSRDHVGFYYRELASYADYNSGKKVAEGWQKGLQVTKAPSCYSTMVLMQNDSIGFLYEESLYNEGYDIIFKSFSLDSITGGKYTLDKTVDRFPYMRDALQQRLDAVQSGDVVGMYESVSTLQPLIEAFEGSKSEADFEAVLEGLQGLGRIAIDPEMTYSLSNKYNPEAFLAADEEGKVLTTVENDEGQLFVFQLTEDGSFLLRDVKSHLYVGKTGLPSADIMLVEQPEEAATYRVESSLDGWSIVFCTEPRHSDYPAISLAATGKLHAYTLEGDNSLWCIVPRMSYVDAIRTPETGAGDVNAPAYDLQGRRVSTSQQGVYIRGNKKYVSK